MGLLTLRPGPFWPFEYLAETLCFSATLYTAFLHVTNCERRVDKTAVSLQNSMHFVCDKVKNHCVSARKRHS